MTRIIVADDDRITSHLLCAILRREGHVADAALDVPALRDACARAPAPVAILLDLHMPGGSAEDSFRAIADRGLAGVPVIVVSGSESPAELAQATALGAVACLQKPIEPDRLLDTLRRALDANDAGGK